MDCVVVAMEPAIAVTVVFDIQPIDAYIRAEGENVLYLAGFARGISDFHSVFQRAEEIIVNKDIHTIVWCGDVIKIDSFTAFIPYLIQQSIASNRPIQKLVAIMYEKSGEEYCLDQRFEAKDLGDTANTQKVPVYTIALPNDGEPDYFELAKRVLEMSKASTILALGDYLLHFTILYWT